MEAVSDRRRISAVLLFSTLALLTAGLVTYSQTRAFAWDEGFHILTAQLIKHGKRPYIDFVFSQTPLNAYWNAAWMAVFGETWRVPHFMAALCSAGAVILTTGFVFSRFPVPGWRLPGALMAALLVGLNVLVVRYGGIAQAYGLSLLATVAAYRFAVRSVERRTVLSAGLSGLACGIAAASTLLTAPLSPVLLIWILVYSQAQLRWTKLAAFVLGVAAAFLPVLWLFAQGPRQVLFGVIQYNALYRQLEWKGAFGHNLEVFASWIDSGPTLLLLLLAAGGLLFIYFRSNWEPQRKAEFYLCAWLSIALAAYISSVLPTFQRYYIFSVPFLGILAVAGIYAAVASLYTVDRPWQPVLLLTFLLSFGLAKALYDQRDTMVWPDLEKTARKVNEVTAPQQRLFADEAIYFLTGHAPPSGMEMENSHKFSFPQAQLALLHLLPQAELDRQVKAGAFRTLETCEEEDDLKEHGYAKLYAKNAAAGECTVFWDVKSTER
jgi:4-amino-4-deoxy-L-arabinose transferase-like glycosyltransferase